MAARQTAKQIDGEQLYQMYTDANLNQNCGVDPWEALDEKDQTVWNEMAQRLLQVE